MHSGLHKSSPKPKSLTAKDLQRKLRGTSISVFERVPRGNTAALREPEASHRALGREPKVWISKNLRVLVKK